MKNLLLANDIIWIITALVCIFYESPTTTFIICFTTIIYALDLFIKCKDLKWNFKAFFKQYWLDILFLVPFVKIFRGFRIFKFGRIIASCLKIVDASADLSEIGFRTFNFIKKCKKEKYRYD